MLPHCRRPDSAPRVATHRVIAADLRPADIDGATHRAVVERHAPTVFFPAHHLPTPLAPLGHRLRDSTIPHQQNRQPAAELPGSSHRQRPPRGRTSVALLRYRISVHRRLADRRFTIEQLGAVPGALPANAGARIPVSVSGKSASERRSPPAPIVWSIRAALTCTYLPFGLFF